MKNIDRVMLLLFVILNVVLFFFRGCNWCLWALLLAAIVGLAVGISQHRQNRHYDDLTEQLENDDAPDMQ
ncbi:MAG: phosphatase PAP2 family protein [Ruthenibacterium sp.]